MTDPFYHHTLAIYLRFIYSTSELLNLLKYEYGPSAFRQFVNGYTLRNKLGKRKTNRKKNSLISYCLYMCNFFTIFDRNDINTCINLRNNKSSHILFCFKSATSYVFTLRKFLHSFNMYNVNTKCIAHEEYNFFCPNH